MRILVFRKISKTIFLFITLAFASLTTGQVNAESVTFDFTIQVNDSTGTDVLSGGEILAGSTLTGSYTFDSTTPDKVADPQHALYEAFNLPQGYHIEHEGNVILTGPAGRLLIYIDDNTSIGFDDIYGVLEDNIDPSNYPTVDQNVNPIGNSGLWIEMTGDDFLTGDALPLVPPPLQASNYFEMKVFKPGGADYLFHILGVVTSLTLHLDPMQRIGNLVNAVLNLNLSEGISNSLDSKLDAALGALNDMKENNDGAACNTLSSFIHSVEAQSGNMISSSDAESLIADAVEIQNQLQCN